MSKPQRLLQQQTDRRYTGAEAKAMAEMRKVWGAVSGYFPGRAMPVPRFGGGPTRGSVGWARNPAGQPVPIGVRLDAAMVDGLIGRRDRDEDPRQRPLGKRQRQEAYQAAMSDLIHEWAHNFQSPSTYQAEQTHPRPTIEGGAEAFAAAVGPGVARALGRRYRPRAAAVSMRLSEYRPYVAQLLRRPDAMQFVLKGQFGQ